MRINWKCSFYFHKKQQNIWYKEGMGDTNAYKTKVIFEKHSGLCAWSMTHIFDHVILRFSIIIWTTQFVVKDFHNNVYKQLLVGYQSFPLELDGKSRAESRHNEFKDCGSTRQFLTLPAVRNLNFFFFDPGPGPIGPSPWLPDNLVTVLLTGGTCGLI